MAAAGEKTHAKALLEVCDGRLKIRRGIHEVIQLPRCRHPNDRVMGPGLGDL
jgi:hypothetical protein